MMIKHKVPKIGCGKHRLRGGYRINAGRKPSWYHKETKTIRIPIFFETQVMNYARELDSNYAKEASLKAGNRHLSTTTALTWSEKEGILNSIPLGKVCIYIGDEDRADISHNQALIVQEKTINDSGATFYKGIHTNYLTTWIWCKLLKPIKAFIYKGKRIEFHVNPQLKLVLNTGWVVLPESDVIFTNPPTIQVKLLHSDWKQSIPIPVTLLQEF